MIRIADNGPGMREDVIRRIYDPFFTTKEVGKGTGLGMAISHQIVVERHRGILKCRSRPGEGTEFWIQIPLNCSTSNTAVEAESRDRYTQFTHQVNTYCRCRRLHFLSYSQAAIN